MFSIVDSWQLHTSDITCVTQNYVTQNQSGALNPLIPHMHGSIEVFIYGVYSWAQRQRVWGRKRKEREAYLLVIAEYIFDRIQVPADSCGHDDNCTLHEALRQSKGTVYR